MAKAVTVVDAGGLPVTNIGALTGLAAGTTADTAMYAHVLEYMAWPDLLLTSQSADSLQLIADKLVEFG